VLSNDKRYHFISWEASRKFEESISSGFENFRDNISLEIKRRIG
jgi:hypothetical protein